MLAPWRGNELREKSAIPPLTARRGKCYNSHVFGKQDVEPLPSIKSQNPNHTICPPLWVYASAHRFDPIGAGFKSCK